MGLAGDVVRPAVLILDVNQTLSDMSPLAARFETVGLPVDLMATWFSTVLHDGITLTASGAYASFAALGKTAAVELLATQDPSPENPDAAAEYVMAGLGDLPLHDDVQPALERLHAAGIRLVTLTNGSRSHTITLLQRAGVDTLVEENLSVDDVGRWKPAREAYHYALARCGVDPTQAMMTAVHPWDIDGAKRAGLAGAWINRRRLHYPAGLRAPDVSAPNFLALADALLN